MISTPAASQAPLKLSVVLPGYNEAQNIEVVVGRCLAALRTFSDRYEVVIVDDGSTDGTAAIADRLSAECPEVRVIHNPINLGVGAAVLIGFASATGDVVVHDSMDYPFDLLDLDRILPLFPKWDVVAVTRTDRSAHSPYRKVTSLVHYWLIRVLFGVPFRDMNFVQVYKGEVLRALHVKAKSPAFVTPELLIRARDHGFMITEIEAPFHPRRQGVAHYGKPRDILWAIADMLSFWIERRLS